MNDCVFSELWRQVERASDGGRISMDALAEVMMRFDGRKVRVNGQIIGRTTIQAAARRMLQAGVPRAVAVRRLMHHYGISRRHAYRYVNEALRHG